MLRLKEVLENKKNMAYAVAIAIFVLAITLTSVGPWATDGYEDITTKSDLETRITTALSNHQEQVMIDYSGENYAELKSWLKEEFMYTTLSQLTSDEFAVYNLDGAKFTYWTYGNKKRVKITISYKLTNEQIDAINTYADDLINRNGLRNMNQYEQIRFVHDYLINNFTYNVKTDNLYEMIETGTANCHGYTMMNLVILQKLGIEVRTTYGMMNDTHIWNAVKLDGNWYYEDITWDTVSKGTDYLLISSQRLQQSHRILGGFVPDCSADYVPSVQTTETQTPATEDVKGEELEDGETIIVTPSETETVSGNTVTSDTDEGLGDGEEDEMNSEQMAEQPQNPFREEEVEVPAPTTIPNDSANKTDKIQKLSKLLKTLKTLKNK